MACGCGDIASNVVHGTAGSWSLRETVVGQVLLPVLACRTIAVYDLRRIESMSESTSNRRLSVDGGMWHNNADNVGCDKETSEFAPCEA